MQKGAEMARVEAAGTEAALLRFAVRRRDLHGFASLCFASLCFSWLRFPSLRVVARCVALL